MSWFIDNNPENDESHAQTRYNQQLEYEEITGLNKKDTVMTLIAGGLIGALIVLLFTFIVSV